MQTTSQLFANYKVTTTKSRRSERGDLISYFAEKMNHSREISGYKPFSISQWSYFLSLFTVSDLYLLRIKCDKSKNFGKTFNYFVFKK